MRVTLKLFATFRRYLPPGSRGHAHDLEVAAGALVADVLARFEVPTDGVVILVNGHAAALERPLDEGDVVAVFPALAGG